MKDQMHFDSFRKTDVEGLVGFLQDLIWPAKLSNFRLGLLCHRVVGCVCDKDQVIDIGIGISPMFIGFMHIYTS
jgi:hypothetical protein